MAAIITQTYRKNLAKLLENSFADSNYFVGLGKSDPWFETLSTNQTSPFPLGTPDDCKGVLENLTDIIRIHNGDFSRVIPNVNSLSAGSYYKKFDPYDAACLYPSTVTYSAVEYNFRPAYLIEPTSGNVFLVIDSPSTPTALDLNTVGLNDFLSNGNSGSITIDGDPFNKEMFIANGYTLVCIGSIDPNSKFNNEQFVRIGTETISGPHNYSGCVYGFHVANGGAGYTSSNFSVNVYGVNNAGVSQTQNIEVDVIISGGVITSVKPKYAHYDDLLNGVFNDINFTKGIAELVTEQSTGITTVATLYPCISNTNGFKYDITEYTPAWYICFLTNSRLSTHAVYTSYSQVSLIKDPRDETDDIITSDTKDLKKSFTLASYTNVSLDSTKTYSIIQKDSGGNIVRRIGSADSFEIDGSNTIVYYTPSAKYGFDTPSTASTHTVRLIDILDSTEINTSKAPTALSAPAVSSADVLFIDNRAPIVRTEDQNEELKIIIQL